MADLVHAFRRSDAEGAPSDRGEASGLVDRARVLATDFAKDAARLDAEAAVPSENFERMAGTGLLGLTVPRRLGGGGGDLRTAGAIIGAIGKAEPATALILAMQYNQHRRVAEGRWPQHIADRVGREAAGAGVSLLNALRVEPELGTPTRGGMPATVAARTASGWRISGHKIYCTGIPVLSWLMVWARTDEPDPRVGIFLVPARAPGVRVVETWDQLGMRATASHDVIFEDVEIPADHAVDIALPSEQQGPSPIDMAWNAGLIGSLYHGVACAARDWLVRFLQDRVPSGLGKSLASLPRFQEAVGGMELLLATNTRLLRSLASDTDGGDVPSIAESGAVKVAVTENAIAATQKAVELSSNRGLSRAQPLERHLRDVLCARIHTPQDDSVRLTLGRKALGSA
ncbi:acyl-CoA dehydrogenase family protein [Marinivivus vitaminiproducens]|uniref:acyl-CoA dehydrogenase family protein n=1 Tax=Marinivivus vitaminiproducens TaxID=3035935 RepID=UPI0027A9BF81|nr:acyl-CoA/acyl-ACP dehydrogenase [Geminicoccaceae bacterium SCSIO 64248]